MDDASNPHLEVNKVILNTVERLKQEQVKGEMVVGLQPTDKTDKRVIDIDKKTLTELLGTDDKEQVRSVMNRIYDLSKNTLVGQLIRGLGQQAAEVSALAYYILQSRLVRTPHKFTNVELSAISTYASQRAESMLDKALPEESPDWNGLRRDKASGITDNSIKLD